MGKKMTFAKKAFLDQGFYYCQMTTFTPHHPPPPILSNTKKTSQKGLEVMKADQITDGKINLISEVRRVLLYDRQTDRWTERH